MVLKTSLVIFLLVSVIFSVPASANGSTAPFLITSLFISGANNAHFRVSGMSGSDPAMATCVGGFAYIDQTDSGAQDKIAALMLAYSQGQRVTLTVSPVNYNNSGTIFCNILELNVGG